MSAKIYEAEEHCKAAEKYLKTTFLRWKPDLDSAADEYCQAAQCYRIARELRGAKDCNLKAADLYRKNHSFFHAGKALESAIVVCKEQNDPLEMYDLALQASTLYQQHGSGDAAANVLAKTAKIIEEKAPDRAVKLYQQAADVSATESGQHMGAEYIAKATKLLIRHEWYDLAVDSIRQEIGYHGEANNRGAMGRLCVAMVLVQLARGDSVAAEKAYKEWGGYCEQPEMVTVEQLITAFDEEDRDSAKAALNAPFIRHMDIEFSRLALKIQLPAPMEVPQRPVDNGGPSSEGDDNVRQQVYDDFLKEGNEPNAKPVEYYAGRMPQDDDDDLC